MMKKLCFTATLLAVIACTACAKTASESETVALDQAKIGDHVLFGKYEQDNNTSNGKEDIEWIVLNTSGNKLLVISRYVLDSRPYTPSIEVTTWETSGLRAWLNGPFLDEAFTAEELKQIPDTTVKAENNPRWETFAGNDTTDQVFCLNIQEANSYFDNASKRKCTATAYAKAAGVETYDGNYCFWWLRSPGVYQERAASVQNNGEVFETGGDVFISTTGVRPVMWIDPGT